MASPYCIKDALLKGAKNMTELAGTILKIKETCPKDMLDPAKGILSFVAANALTTGNPELIAGFGAWTTYQAKTIIGRLIDFKIPLIVLILQLARAPLGSFIESFTVLHLVANPSDSIASFFHTLSFCFGILEAVREAHGVGSEYGAMGWKKRPWRDRFSRAWRKCMPSWLVQPPKPDEVEDDCKVLALVLGAYMFIGIPPVSMGVASRPANRRAVISKAIIKQQVGEQNRDPDAFRKAARSLAADRRIHKLPVLAALFGFVTAVLFKYIYIDHDEYDKENPQAIQLWSLSSSMTISWPIIAEFQSWIIGVPKSADSTRRILHQLEEDLGYNRRKLQLSPRKRDTVPILVDFGALPNFRPDRWHKQECHPDDAIHAIAPKWLDMMAFFIVSTGCLGGVWLAARVPPEGWNCRAANKVFMLSNYALSAAVQSLILNRRSTDKLGSWARIVLTTVVDLIVFASLAGDIFITQAGVFNCPGCFVEMVRGIPGVLLTPFSWDIVRKRLEREYPGILFGIFLLQFVICVVILICFWEARGVFRQSDVEPEYEGPNRKFGPTPAPSSVVVTAPGNHQQEKELVVGHSETKEKIPEVTTVPVLPDEGVSEAHGLPTVERRQSWNQSALL
ncbi:hypothetical protein B0T16DRAFT_490259 [Cercophora newfieldiana]|uniref:Uncharacterized protein n=1 Tax=Cercophora newfieldiana TaxID=92897 RepID=A0AA39YGV7_9PEZI|nr:hypothetical protein B0T16DRAFT_490259 [Cercophora newfieldiana]